MRSVVEGLTDSEGPSTGFQPVPLPNGQVRIAPRSEALSGGQGDLSIYAHREDKRV
jgi:hypothetical protein